MKVDPSPTPTEIIPPSSSRAGATPKKRWTVKRVFGRAALILGGAAFAGYFAINLTLQSSGARAWVIGMLRDRVGMEFYFDEVRWSPFDGVLVYGLKVEQSEDATREAPDAPPFFHAHKVRMDLFWADLVKGQRRVKAIEVVKPEVFIVRSNSGKLLLPPTLTADAPSAGPTPILKPAPQVPVADADRSPADDGEKPADDQQVADSGEPEQSPTSTKTDARQVVPPVVMSPELLVEGGKFTIYDADSRTLAVELVGVGVTLPQVVDAESQTTGEIAIASGHVALVPGLSKDSSFWPMQWPVKWESSAIRGERKEFAVPGGKLFGAFLWNPRVEGVPLVVAGDLQQFNLVDAVTGPEGDFQLESCWLTGQVRFEALLSRSNSAVLTGALGAENVVIKGGPALSRFASGVGQQFLLDEGEDGEGTASDQDKEVVRMMLPVGVARFRWSPTSMQEQKVDFQAAASGMSVSGAAVVSRSGRVVSRATCLLSGPAMHQLEKLEERLPRALHFGFRPVNLPTLPSEEKAPAASGSALVSPEPAEVLAVGREFLISGTLKEPLIAVWDRGELLTFGSLVRRISANIMPPPEPEPETIDDELLPMD